MTVADSQTARLLGQGRRLEHFTIGWNVLEAGVSVWAGIVAGSTALIGFGLDSAHIATTETPFPEKYLVAGPGPFCRQARPRCRLAPQAIGETRWMIQSPIFSSANGLKVSWIVTYSFMDPVSLFWNR